MLMRYRRDLDRQHIQDRERWKREMAHKIKDTKLQMMKLTDNQLEMTTKRTIMENEQMSIELSYQSRQTEKLLNKNARLVDENAELRRQIELSKQTETELAKRNGLYQKTIKTLVRRWGAVPPPLPLLWRRQLQGSACASCALSMWGLRLRCWLTADRRAHVRSRTRI